MPRTHWPLDGNGEQRQQAAAALPGARPGGRGCARNPPRRCRVLPPQTLPGPVCIGDFWAAVVLEENELEPLLAHVEVGVDRQAASSGGGNDNFVASTATDKIRGPLERSRFWGDGGEPGREVDRRRH